MGTERLALGGVRVRLRRGVCVCVCLCNPKSGLHERSVCGGSAARRSIHVAAANGMTTSLLPITICLLCANLSEHIRARPCPHLTLSKSQGRTGGGKGKKGETRAPTRSAALGANCERGQLEFIRGQRRGTHTGGRPGDSAGSGANRRPASKSGPGSRLLSLSRLGFVCKDRNPPPPKLSVAQIWRNVSLIWRLKRQVLKLGSCRAVASCGGQMWY